MKKTILIAEAGVNHNGKIKSAIKLIDKAASSGADYVKFQHTNPNLISKSAKKADYQIKNTKSDESQRDMIKKLHLNWKKAYPILLKRCKKKKIKFLTSVFSKKDYLWIKKYNLDYIKIPSGEIINTPLLEEISKSNKQIILSTGMANVQEITEALKVLSKKCDVKKKVTLMHCVTAYPTPYKDVNLLSIPYLRKKFKLNIGLSDHSLGIEVPISSISLGAKIIEKHFTLSKKLPGPDHSASLEPEEFKKMANCIRNVELSMGIKRKLPSKIELKTKKLVRQSIHATKDIKKGEKFSHLNIALMRPANGLKPKFYKKIIGTKSKKNYKFQDAIK